MSGNSNTIEIKLKFLTEKIDAIQGSVKELEGLKRQALSTASALKGAALIGGITVAAREIIQVFGEVKKAIDLGGELSDLSARTGQSVSDLVVLRQAFTNAGIGAESTGQLLNLLQKSLTGVNEEGEPTSKAFDRLGISLENLKAQSAVGQLETLSSAFIQIANPADRTRTAMELFGRSGGQMLAVLSDSSAMSVARQQVGSLGETMEKNAAAFDKLGDSWDAIGLRVTQLFSGIAEEIAPMLQRIADSANSMDLTKAGKEIGDLVNGLVTLMQVVAPVAATLGAGLVLEKTLAALAAFVGGVSASTTALAAETAALSANTAAQGANAAARVGPGAAWGKALPIPVATKGAPYSKEAYTSARNMGMNPETALMAARHAMVAAADGAAKATPLWTRLTGGLSTASAGLTKFLNNIMSVPNLLALGFASMSVGFMRDQASRFGYSVLGGATDATDQRKADEMRAAKSEQYAALAERVKNVGTQDDRDALAEEIAKTASEDASGIVSSKDAGDPRAAQNLVLKNSVANLSTLLGILGRKEGLLTPEEGLLNGLVTQSRDRIEAEQKRTELSSKSGADTFAADKFKDMSLPEQVSDLEKRRAQLGEAYNSSSSTDEEKNAALAVANNLLAQELDIRRKIKEEAKADAKTEKDNSAKRKDFFANLAISEAEYSGDKDGAARLKWNLDRMRLQKELEEMGSKDSWGESARMTNAQAAGKDARNFDKSVSSAMHAVGGARGEVYGAQSAVVAAVNKTNDLLQKIYGKPAVVVDTAARFS